MITARLKSSSCCVCGIILSLWNIQDGEIQGTPIAVAVLGNQSPDDFEKWFYGGMERLQIEKNKDANPFVHVGIGKLAPASSTWNWMFYICDCFCHNSNIRTKTQMVRVCNPNVGITYPLDINFVGI